MPSMVKHVIYNLSIANHQSLAMTNVHSLQGIVKYWPFSSRFIQKFIKRNPFLMYRMLYEKILQNVKKI